MRKYIGILVCLILLSGGMSSVYGQNFTFHSTSAYVEVSRSQGFERPVNRPMTTGSLSSISASNFQTLNSEGGACYSPTATYAPRRGRSDDGGSIGDYGFHSPVGDTPWILFALLAVGYAIFVKKRKKMQKNLVES